MTKKEEDCVRETFRPGLNVMTAIGVNYVLNLRGAERRRSKI